MAARKGQIVEQLEADWYDFPHWYDILHHPGTAWEVTGLQRIERRYGSAGSRKRENSVWLEPACGTGRYLRLAARRGHRVFGFDRNTAMVEYARQRIAVPARRAKVFQAELTSFRIPARADFAFCLINTLRHLSCDEQMLAHLRLMRRALANHAVYAVGLSTSHYGAEQESEDIWHGARGSCRVTQVVQYLPPDRRRRREWVISHLAVNTPTREHHLTTRYALRSYDVAQWLRLIRRSPFELVAVCDEWGEPIGSPEDPGFQSGYALWILRPRARASKK